MENWPTIRKHLVEQHVCILQVVEGEAQNIVSEQKTSKVVVKILHEDATTTDQMYFLHEVKPYRELDHPNILKLLGRCLETDPFLVLLEPCPSVSFCAFYIFFMPFSGSEWIAAFRIHVSMFYSVLGNTFFLSVLHRVCSMLEMFFLVFHFQHIFSMPSCFSMSCVIYSAIYYLFTLLTL